MHSAARKTLRVTAGADVELHRQLSNALDTSPSRERDSVTIQHEFGWIRAWPIGAHRLL